MILTFQLLLNCKKYIRCHLQKHFVFFNHLENCVRFVLHLMCFFATGFHQTSDEHNFLSVLYKSEIFCKAVFIYFYYNIHVYFKLLYTCTNMTLSTHDQNLTIICSFFQIMYMYLISFVNFFFFAKNVFFSVLAVEGPLSLLSALECKILEINFYYCPNHDFF